MTTFVRLYPQLNPVKSNYNNVTKIIQGTPFILDTLGLEERFFRGGAEIDTTNRTAYEAMFLAKEPKPSAVVNYCDNVLIYIFAKDSTTVNAVGKIIHPEYYPDISFLVVPCFYAEENSLERESVQVVGFSRTTSLYRDVYIEPDPIVYLPLRHALFDGKHFYRVPKGISPILEREEAYRLLLDTDKSHVVQVGGRLRCTDLSRLYSC